MVFQKGHKGFNPGGQGKFKKGKDNVNWKGGVTPPSVYPREFNKALKRKIRQRDNFTCCLCGRTEREEDESRRQSVCYEMCY